jgi:hypothetical protein
VHRSYKFSLLTVAHDVNNATFTFFLTDISQLADARRTFHLSPAEIALINPNTKTTPVFRAVSDASLTTRIQERIPIFSPDANPTIGAWDVRFHARIWHMAEDSHWFVTLGETLDRTDQQELVPIYEAKFIHQYDHRLATYENSEDVRDLTVAEKMVAAIDPKPRYWVPKKEATSRLDDMKWKRQWLMGWRKIGRSNDERSIIVSLIPLVAAGDSLPLIFPRSDVQRIVCLYANLNSLVVDYTARQKLGGVNVTVGLVRQLPVLLPGAYTDADIAFITTRVLELTYTSHSMTPFARDLNYQGEPFSWDEDRRALLRSELDAWYARAYDLSRDDLRYILDPADMFGMDYPSETFRVLKKNEINKYGEYRTQRLVLDAWDRQAAGDLPASEFDRIPQALTALPSIQPSNYAGLLDGAWMNRALFPDRDADAYGALAAIVHALQGPTPQDIVRLAYRFALVPKKLTPLLDDTNRALWLRLVGREAQPNPDNVAEMMATVDAPFGQALRTLRSQRALVENMAAGTWAFGTAVSGLDFTAPLESRARFALDAVRSTGLDQLLGSMQPEEIAWLERRLA